MSITPIAARYASALFSLADEQGCLDEVGAELDFVARTIRDYPDLAKLLAHPLVSGGDKRATLLAVTPGATELTHRFLALVVDKGREAELPGMAAAYARQLDARHQRVFAEVITAVPLDEAAVAQLQTQLSGFLSQDVTLARRVDPEILGGVVVRVGDRLIDGSVKARLQELAESLN